MSDAFAAAPLRAAGRVAKVVGIVESTAQAQPGPDHWSLLRYAAERRRVPYFVMGSRSERPAAFIEGLKPDVICVAGMAQLLRRAEFGIARLGAINLHPSLLPRYRGPKPYLWQSAAMDVAGGVTVHRIDEGIDTGDILCQRRFRIPLGMTYSQLRGLSITAGAAAMEVALRQLATGAAMWTRQPADAPTPYARKPRPGEQLLDWRGWPIERVWHFLRSVDDEYRPLPRVPGRDWVVGKIDPTRTNALPGIILRDDAGFFAAHAGGRIRLTLKPRRDLLAEKLHWWTRRVRQKWEWRSW